MPLDTWPPPPWEGALEPPGPWRPETPGDPWTLTGEPLGEARVWSEDPEGSNDDVAAMLYFVEGRGYAWWTWGPYPAPDDGGGGTEPTREAARDAADKWLADYVRAHAGGGQ